MWIRRISWENLLEYNIIRVFSSLTIASDPYIVIHRGEKSMQVYLTCRKLISSKVEQIFLQFIRQNTSKTH